MIPEGKKRERKEAKRERREERETHTSNRHPGSSCFIVGPNYVNMCFYCRSLTSLRGSSVVRRRPSSIETRSTYLDSCRVTFSAVSGISNPMRSRYLLSRISMVSFGEKLTKKGGGGIRKSAPWSGARYLWMRRQRQRRGWSRRRGGGSGGRMKEDEKIWVSVL